MPQGDSSAREQLRQAGLRITEPRRAVLNWLAEHPHATADQIGRGVAERGRSVSTQAVYDVLLACAGAGLVRWIEPAGHPTRYERRTGDNHHHLVCRGCGRIDDVDCAVGEPPCLAPDDDHDYELEQAEVVFWGMCRDCSNAAQPRAPETSATRPVTDSTHHEEAWQ